LPTSAHSSPAPCGDNSDIATAAAATLGTKAGTMSFMLLLLPFLLLLVSVAVAASAAFAAAAVAVTVGQTNPQFYEGNTWSTSIRVMGNMHVKHIVNICVNTCSNIVNTMFKHHQTPWSTIIKHLGHKSSKTIVNNR
jgi:hypothetical protein